MGIKTQITNPDTFSSSSKFRKGMPVKLSFLRRQAPRPARKSQVLNQNKPCGKNRHIK